MSTGVVHTVGVRGWYWISSQTSDCHTTAPGVAAIDSPRVNAVGVDHRRNAGLGGDVGGEVPHSANGAEPAGVDEGFVTQQVEQRIVRRGRGLDEVVDDEPQRFIVLIVQIASARSW